MHKGTFKFIPAILAMIAGVGAIVMLLWNWLHDVFGCGSITYWQAIGLLILARILFGKFGRHWMGAHHRHHHNPLHEKWHEMTKEERRDFLKNQKEHLRRFHRGGRGGCFNERDFDLNEKDNLNENDNADKGNK